MVTSFLLVALGIALLVAGGELMLRGAVRLASLLQLTPAVIGLTVVAAGTSVPELAVSASAALRGQADIAVANVVGSNIFNATVIIGLCAMIRPLSIVGNTIRFEYPVLALVTLLCVVVMDDGSITRLDAALLVAIYACFTAYLVSLVRARVSPLEAAEFGEEVRELAPDAGNARLMPAIGLSVAGIALLAGGAQATVTGAVELARLLGWSERVIGLTIVSIGTGLPEVFASVISGLRGRGDIAFGNVIGSNLFNILMILGLSAAVSPLPVAPGLVASDAWWMLGVTLLLFPLMLTGLRVGRGEGVLLLGVYGAYLGLLLAAGGV